ncbi:MAG TPA: hypothetical protein VJ180_14770 [Pyrinomonadaceae bacterium]|nr:hypothetical protein [Pyrinomonadaceae bacterium]
MDLNKILELLQHYPAWFKWGIAAWVILTALILVGLLILRDAAQNKPVIVDSPPIQAPQPSSVVSKTVEIRVVSPAVPRTHPIKFKEYALRMKALEGRFLERQEFIDSLSNVIVEWEGIVDRVAERRQGEFSYLSMFIESGSRPEMSALVALPNAMRTKAFSLRKGDTVRVVGKLELRTLMTPDIDASELTVVRVHGG